jgi:hypothetical protein
MRALYQMTLLYHFDIQIKVSYEHLVIPNNLSHIVSCILASTIYYSSCRLWCVSLHMIQEFSCYLRSAFLLLWGQLQSTVFSSSISLVAWFITRYLHVLLFLPCLVEMESKQHAHLPRTMAQQEEWTPTTVYASQVSGTQCMLSPSNCPLPLVVLALTSFKPTTSTFIASNPLQVCLRNSLCTLTWLVHFWVGVDYILIGGYLLVKCYKLWFCFPPVSVQ